MALVSMYTIVFTKQVQNRASALNIMQIKDESLITVDNIRIIITIIKFC